MDIETYALAKAYTDKEFAGGGAIKGKNCVITQIEEITGGHIVHFQWTLDDGTVETDTMTVMDGEDGTQVSASETNGNIILDGVETQVYDDSEIRQIIDTTLETIEGNPLNFSTLSAQTAESTIIDLEPIQDLHGYDKPWVGGAGKNLYIGSPSFDGYTNLNAWTKESQTYNGHDVYSNSNAWGGMYQSLNLKAGTYTFSCMVKGENNPTGYIFLSVNGQQTTLYNASISNTWTKIYGTFTLAEDTSNITLRAEKGTDGKIYVSEYQLEKASSPTTYEPYENLCPITGRTEVNIDGCGVNLLNPQYRVDGTTTIKYYDGIGTGVKLKANTRYALCIASDNTAPSGLYIKDFSTGTSLATAYSNRLLSYTPSEDVIVKADAYYQNAPSETIANVKMQLVEYDYRTQYTAYQSSNSLTIAFGQTVYGGQVDVEKGELVVDRTIVDMGDMNWVYWDYQGIGNLFYSGALNNLAKVTDDTIPISSHYNGETNAVDNVTALNKGNGICCFRYPTFDRFYVRDDRYSDSQTFKSAMSGVQLCYELATPITINLTPHTINLLKGVNNISTDGDSITLTYRDGSVATLGDLTSAVDNLDSKIDESKILTDTETGTKYRLVVTDGVLGIEEVTEPNALSTSPLSLSNSSVETSEESSEESNE